MNWASNSIIYLIFNIYIYKNIYIYIYIYIIYSQSIYRSKTVQAKIKLKKLKDKISK